MRPVSFSEAADGDGTVVLSLLDAVDADVIALAAAHVHMDAVAHLRAHDGAAHRRFFADKALQGVLPQVVTSWIFRLLPRFSIKISTVSYSPAVSAEERSSITWAVLIIRWR